MKYYPKMLGEKVYLSPICVDDAPLYTKWLNDEATSANLSLYRDLVGLSGERTILEKMAVEGHNYAIVLRETDTLIGNIGFVEREQITRRGTVGLFIGEEAHRGKGYGAQALRLILHYGFHTLNLNNIMLTVHADNPRAIACYTKVGFREFGRRRQCEFKRGYYTDLVYMDILATEFSL